MAEEGGFEEVGGDGSGVDGNERLVAAGGVGVKGFGDEFFAGAGLALNEDGGAAGGYLGDEVEEAEHGFGFADDVLEVVALLEGSLEVDDLLFGLVAGDGGADVGEEFLVVPGLLDEVFGTGADGVDDVAYGAVGRDHDDGELRVHLDDAGEEVDAGLAGEGEVEEEEVVLIAGEGFEAGGAVDREGDGEAFEGEKGVEGLADGGFVVDDEDAGEGGVGGGAGLRGGLLGFQAWIASFVSGAAVVRAAVAGNSRRKVVPTFTSDSTRILPACSCMMP